MKNKGLFVLLAFFSACSYAVEFDTKALGESSFSVTLMIEFSSAAIEEKVNLDVEQLIQSYVLTSKADIDYEFQRVRESTLFYLELSGVELRQLLDLFEVMITSGFNPFYEKGLVGIVGDPKLTISNTFTLKL